MKPHGKGEQADVHFTFSMTRNPEAFLEFKKELLITAVQQDEGFIVNEKDTWSQFDTDYEAQEGGYIPQYRLVMDRTPSTILESAELAKTEYLTFRTRIIRDDEGKIISSHFGKITDIMDYGEDGRNSEGGGVHLVYYFNPTSNDRNIESK